MASLRPELVAGGMVWLSELSDRGAYRLSGWELDRARGLGFALVRSGRGRRWRGGKPPAALGLWDELPSGSRVLV